MQRTLLSTALLLATALCVAQPSFASCDSYWALYPNPGCADIPAGYGNVLEVPAGDYGVFYFAQRALKDRFCKDRVIGGGFFAGDTVEYYPSPGAGPMSGACSGGSCLTPRTSVGANWVGVLDWDDWHGHSIGALALSSSDTTLDAALYPLEQVLPWAQGSCTGISDHDVLVRLAELVERVDRQHVAPPRVINMSFGRQVVSGDPHHRWCRDLDSLPCHLSQLLGHISQPDLTQPPRTALVAAAGNHQELLFPASLKQVIAAGSLDLLEHDLNGDSRPTWESPGMDNSAFALMPGSGLCLDQGVTGHLLPAGSSFSSALFAGWLTEAWTVQPTAVLDRLDNPYAIWEPRWSCNPQPCRLVLAHGNDVFDTPTNNASTLIKKALNGEVDTCGPIFGAGLELSLDMVPLGNGDLNPLKLRSLSAEVADSHKPAPEPDPCVPCAISCHVLRSGSMAPVPAQVLVRDPEPGPGPAMRNFTVRLTIDLHSSWELGPETVLEGLYVRLGDDPPQRVVFDADGWQLDLLARGDVAKLFIDGSVPSLTLSKQPSLITLHRVLATGNLVWDSTPMVPFSP